MAAAKSKWTGTARHWRTLVAFGLPLLLFPGSGAEAASTAEERRALFSHASAPTAFSSFPVGWWNTSIPDAGVNNASAQATIWYPATRSGDRPPPELSGAPYTTMIWAPGFSANRLSYVPYLVSMAKLGIVVVGVDFDTRQPIHYAEPHDQANHTYVAAAWALAQNSTSGSHLEMMVDGSRIAMSGHSMGGRVTALAVGRQAIFRTALPIAPAIDAWPYYQPPPSPQDSISKFRGPVHIPIGDADTSTPYGYNALRLYNSSNCPKQMLLVKGADHGFMQPGTLDLLIRYSELFYRFHLMGDASAYDPLYVSGPKDDLNSGKLTSYLQCPPSGGGSGVASIEVSPRQATVAADATLSFTASGKDAQGNPVSVTPTWSSSGGTVDQSGLFTPGALGKASVTATVGNLSAGAAVDVVTGKVATATVSPPSAKVQVSKSLRFSASGTDSKGNVVPGATVQWTISGATGAIDSSGLFTATTAGTGKITALVSGNGGSAQASAMVEVTDPPPPPPPPQEPKVATASISPASITLRIGEAATFRAVGRDSSGLEVANAAVVWSSTGGIGTVASSGLFTASKAGNGSVRAELSGGGGSAAAVATVTVIPLPAGGGTGTGGNGADGRGTAQPQGPSLLSWLGFAAMALAAVAGASVAAVALRSRGRRGTGVPWEGVGWTQTTAPDFPYRRG
jgi:dienelactone hydrolase